MKTILVPLGGQAGDAATLGTAYLAAQRFQSHLTCLHVRRNANDMLARTTSLGMGMPVITPELWTALEEEDKAMNANARRAFDDFCSRNGVKESEHPAQVHAVTAAWHEVSGDPVHQVIRFGRTSELIVVGRDPEPAGSPGPIGDVLVQSGRPLILAPQSIPATLGATVAIAWKPTAEAARALTAAMPFLETAKKVLIVAAEESGNADAGSGARLVRSLGWNGIHAELHAFKAPDAPPHILDVVMKSGADLMVMGAYSHSRASEFIFGGLTRRVLVDAGIPVLLCH